MPGRQARLSSLRVTRLPIRIVTWNCKLGLDRKWARLQDLAPDISIIQECASPAVLAARGLSLDPAATLWAAKSNARDDNKGLGVFAHGGVEIRPAPHWAQVVARWAEHPYRLDGLLPFEVVAPRRLNILAVWSFNNRDKPGRAKMPGPVLVGLEELRDWLLEAPSLVVGDFNNHVCWDRPGGQNSFARHIEAFGRLGFRSAYHHLGGVAHGEETERTHQWRPSMTYHIDYAFAPQTLLEGARCRIEPLTEWCGKGGVSDHAPLILDIASSTTSDPRIRSQPHR